MKCPKCKKYELKKNGFDFPFQCNHCGGMWLQREELQTFSENVEQLAGEESGPAENDGYTGICPFGHGIMIRAKIDIEEPFYLEKCSVCGGVWFDRGEWQKLVSNNFTQYLNELWCKSWQSRKRKEQNRHVFLESNKKILGENIFEEIMQLSGKLKAHPEKGRAIALLQQEIFSNS